MTLPNPDSENKGGKVVSNRPLKRGVLVFILALIALYNGIAEAQTALDTLYLEPLPPDSVDVFREGRDIVIRWYPQPDSLSSLIGSIDLRNWISDYDPGDISQVEFDGFYNGSVDRTVVIERELLGVLVPVTVGVDSYIPLRIETIDPVNRTYFRTINLGTDYYVPNDDIPAVLINAEDEEDTLDLGFTMSFSPGIIDTSRLGAGARIEIDLQDFEGFHIMRGLSPNPSEMQQIIEISKEDYFKISDIENSGEVPAKWLWLWEYFRDDGDDPAWPRYDAQGREYFEWVDDNVFAGFTYYYHVTCYDRGYFKGFFQHNKEDNYICDEDIENPEDPLNPIVCDDVASSIVMTVEAGGSSDSEMKFVYAVPNPFRTGTSAQSSLAYHNFPDGSIKFFNVPSECELRIFTVAGDLVWKINHSSSDGSEGVVTWDVKNMEGYDVNSGVYIFRCESDAGGQVYGKIVIIR